MPGKWNTQGCSFWFVCAREAGPDSDIDLIVDFLQPTGFLTLVKLERELTEATGRKVDLLTEQAISPHLRERILNEKQVLYEAAR